MLSAYEFEKPYKGLDQGHTGHCLDAHQSCLPAIPVLTCRDVPHYALCAGSVPFAFLLAVVLPAVNKTNHNNNKWDFYEMSLPLLTYNYRTVTQFGAYKRTTYILKAFVHIQ